MILLKPSELDDLSPCPYLPEKKKQYEYFLAHNLNEQEISYLLSEGWRKFGIYFFRTSCPDCRNCIPLRVPTADFSPSKSQRRNLKKNENIVVKFGQPQFNYRAYEIYEAHSKTRFSQDCDMELFIQNFYTPSCPGLQSEYYLDDKLIGVGFLDRGVDCLSSIYFVFDPEYEQMGLGTLSILKEIEHAHTLGLTYYYLGYYVAACDRMSYKDRFRPRQHYDWVTEEWVAGA